jgi:hypothetical protein
MPVFSSRYEERAWRENHCDKCFQPDQALKRVADKGDGCPLLALAERGVKPEQWTKRRKAEMGNTYKCSDFAKTPPSQQRRRAPVQTEALFDDLDPAEKMLVPVDGWPDYKALQRKGDGDHQ